MHTIIKYVEKKYIFNKILSPFSSGDTIQVFYDIREGDKIRKQSFKGIVIQYKGKGATETFTLKKISGGIGVQRIFFVNQPNIQRIEIHKQGKVRQARIYYFSMLKGKKARIKTLYQKYSDISNKKKYKKFSYRESEHYQIRTDDLYPVKIAL